MKIKKTLHRNDIFCDMECPICGHIAKLIENYERHKETIECPVCGYEFNKDTFYANTTEELGYGVLYAEFQNKPFINYIFTEELNETEIENYKKIFDDPFIIKEKSYFYLYNPSEDKLTIEYGVSPQTFADYLHEKECECDFEKYLNSYGFMSLDNYENF